MQCGGGGGGGGGGKLAVWVRMKGGVVEVEREKEVREGSSAIKCLTGLVNLCGIRVSIQISQKITEKIRWDP